MHPDIEVTHPQCEHVLYKISKLEWERMPYNQKLKTVAQKARSV
jgi:ribosomal-protein-alanine N-acetyltransferase